MWKVMSFLVQNSTIGNDQSWPERAPTWPGGNRTLGASRPKIGSQHVSVLGCFLHCGGHQILTSFDFTCFYLSDVDPIPRYAKLQKSMCRRYVGKLVTWNLPEHESEEMWEYMSENTQIMSDHKRQTNISQDLSHPICQSKHMWLYIPVRIYDRWNFRAFRKSKDFRRMIDGSLSSVVSEQFFFLNIFWVCVQKKWSIHHL